MPETAMNKNNLLMSGENDIGVAGKLVLLNAKAVTQTVEYGSYP
jgi:hypothetical protein